jgi:hypothetical protein
MATLAPLGSDAVAVADKQQPAGQQQQQQPNSSTYEVSDPAFSSIIDASVPVRVVAERGYEFAHEAPVYLEKQNKVRHLAAGPKCSCSSNSSSSSSSKWQRVLNTPHATVWLPGQRSFQVTLHKELSGDRAALHCRACNSTSS